MQVTSDGKRRRSASEWESLVSRFRESGLSLREFSRRESVSLGSLQRWNRRLAEATAPQQAGFVDVTPGSVAPSPWQAEIELPNGVIVRLRG